jgi:hypothetical protein
VLDILLMWIPIEDLAHFDIALQNHMDRRVHLSLLRDTEHRGVLSVMKERPERWKGYNFDSGVVAWLESRNVFMRALSFNDCETDLPDGFLERTGRQLEQIDLQSCYKITDRGMGKLAENCPMLQDVKLGCFEITDATIFSLVKHCSRLHSVGLSGANNITDEGLLHLAQGCTDLKKIELSFSTIADAGLRKLAEACPGLEEVILWSCNNITEAAVGFLVQHCHHLHTLDVDTNFTDAGCALFGEGNRAMKEFTLGSCCDISDAGMRSVAAAFPCMEDYKFDFNMNITDEGVAYLGQYCPHLHTVRLSSSNVTPAGYISLGECCPALKDIGQIPASIADEDLGRLAAACPRLEIVVLEYYGNKITDAGVALLALHCPLIHTVTLSGSLILEFGFSRRVVEI